MKLIQLISKIFLIFSLNLSLASVADFNADPTMVINQFRCEKEAKNLIQKWGVTGEWSKHFDGDQGDMKLLSPTNKFAKWFELKLGKNPSAHLISPTTVINVYFDEKCIATSEISKNKKAILKENFNDLELAKLIDANKTGLIYAWSPHMPLSIDGMKEIKEVAAKLNLPLTIVLSPDSNLNEAKKMADKYKLPKEYLKIYDSVEMHERGSSLHFPSLLIYQNGKLFRRARPGHEVAKIFETYLKKAMNL